MIPPSGSKSMSSSPWVDSSTQESSRRLQWNKCMEINPKLRGAKPLLVFQCRETEAGYRQKHRGGRCSQKGQGNPHTPCKQLCQPKKQFSETFTTKCSSTWHSTTTDKTTIESKPKRFLLGPVHKHNIKHVCLQWKPLGKWIRQSCLVIV